MREKNLKILYPTETIKKFATDLNETFKVISKLDDSIKIGDSTNFIADTIGSYRDVIWTPTPTNTFLNLGIAMQKGRMVGKEYVESIVVNAKGSFRDINDNSSTGGLINTQGQGKLLKIYTKTATEEIGFLNAGSNIKGDIVTAQKGFNIVYRDEIDRAGYLGVGGQKGLVNQAFSTANDNDSGKTLDTMTNTELISFLHDVVMKQRAEAGDMEAWADTLIVPPNVYNRIVMSDYKTYTDKTIYVKLEEDSKVKIVSSYLLGKDYNGLGYDVVIAQPTNENIVNFVLPRGLTFTPNIKNHFAIEIGAYYSIGGLDFFIEEIAGRGNFK